MKRFSLLLTVALVFLVALPISINHIGEAIPEAVSAINPNPDAENTATASPATKYGHLIIKEDKLVRKGHFVDSIFSSYENLGIDLHVNYHCINKPLFMVPEPHAHPNYEILCFIGSNPLDIRDFDAEIELVIDDETHIIDSTSFVVIPPGLKHCPLNFKKIDKPIMFMVILTAGMYSTLPEQQRDVTVPREETP